MSRRRIPDQLVAAGIASTGIAGLDDILLGGWIRENMYLVEDTPGSGKGFRTERVANAQDALSGFAGGRDFDLVLSDIVMPGGMSGLELARLIQEQMPGLPVVLVTGYSEALKDGARLGDIPVLHKPYSLHDLGATLRKLCGPANRGRLH